MEERQIDILVGRRSQYPQELMDAIKVKLASKGVDVEDQRILKLIVIWLEQKLDRVSSNLYFANGYSDVNEEKTLELSELKSGLDQMGIKVNRPSFIVGPSVSKLSTRRSKTK